MGLSLSGLAQYVPSPGVPQPPRGVSPFFSVLPQAGTNYVNTNWAIIPAVYGKAAAVYWLQASGGTNDTAISWYTNAAAQNITVTNYAATGTNLFVASTNGWTPGDWFALYDKSSAVWYRGSVVALTGATNLQVWINHAGASCFSPITGIAKNDLIYRLAVAGTYHWGMQTNSLTGYAAPLFAGLVDGPVLLEVGGANGHQAAAATNKIWMATGKYE